MASDALHNLQRIGLLDAVPFSAELQARMLRTAQSRLEDALREGNSLETRFDCAYTAAPWRMQLCSPLGLEHRPASLGTTKPHFNASRIRWV